MAHILAFKDSPKIRVASSVSHFAQASCVRSEVVSLDFGGSFQRPVCKSSTLHCRDALWYPGVGFGHAHGSGADAGGASSHHIFGQCKSGTCVGAANGVPNHRANGQSPAAKPDFLRFVIIEFRSAHGMRQAGRIFRQDNEISAPTSTNSYERHEFVNRCFERSKSFRQEQTQSHTGST